MKTARTYLVRMLILSLLVLQSVPIKALPCGTAGMAYALPEAKAGATYEFPIPTAGGQPPFKWSVAEGELPPGIELQPSGILRGDANRSGSAIKGSTEHQVRIDGPVKEETLRQVAGALNNLNS